MTKQTHWSAKLATLAGITAISAVSLQAGDIWLTGHDVTLHAGQNGNDAVALNYLRGADAAATYDIAVIGTQGVGFAQFTGQGAVNIPGQAHGSLVANTGTLAGYGTVRFYDAATLAADPARAAILAANDAIFVLSHVNCGGCSLTTAGSDALNSMSGDIATAFNAGMDIFGESAANLATYYNFLPPSAVASGAPIGGSSGFTATAEGTAAGLTDPMINGFPTHNRFASADPAFTVLETRGTEIITIALRGGIIVDDGIVSDDGVVGVPEGGMTGLLLGMGMLGLEGVRRRFRR